MSDEPLPNEQDISDVDTARLALRGAVSTLRTLQDLVANLKAENQEINVREKAWKARVETMEQRLSEIHAKWQESQNLIQDYKHEIATQLRSEIAIEEQEKWKAQIAQVQSTLQEWQKARELREAELARTKEVLSEREHEVRRLETEKIAFEHKTQTEIATLLDRSRQALKDAVVDAVDEKNQEIREVKAQWLHESEELKDALHRVEIEMKLKEEAFQKDFHQRRRELEALWRAREEEAWKQAEAIRAQTEGALQVQLQSRLEALDKEKEEHQADYQAKQAALEIQHTEQEKTLAALFQQKEAEIRERYITDLREKEGQLEAQRLQLEHQVARREADLLARVRQEEEALRNSLRQLEAELRATVDAEMARRQATLKTEIAQEQQVIHLRLEDERKALWAEREHWQQETAETRSRLAQEWLTKESALQTRQQGELEALQASWDTKQKEWIANHQVALTKAQDAVAEKLSIMETVFVDRRQGLEEDFRKRQADLETRAGEREAERRQAWIQKESELNERYQVLIKEEQAKIQALLETQKKQLDNDFAKRVEYVEKKKLLLEEQFDQAKAAWQQDVLQKERSLAAQWALKEKQSQEEYQRALAHERNLAKGEIEKAHQDFEAQKQKLEDDLQSKERGLLARATQLESELTAQWSQKEAALQKQLAVDYQERRRELEAHVQATLQTEIQRERAVITDQAEQEKLLWQDQVQREEERLTARKNALEDQFRQKESEIQTALVNEKANLQSIWEKQKQEWLKEHQTLLAQARTDLDAKLNARRT